jgi:hypothetical protein
MYQIGVNYSKLHQHFPSQGSLGILGEKIYHLAALEHIAFKHM